MFILCSTLLTTLFIFIVGVYNNYAFNEAKSFLQLVVKVALGTSLLGGILEGSIHSHGLDLPWYLFSISSFLIVIVFSLLLIGLVRMVFVLKNKNY